VEHAGYISEGQIKRIQEGGDLKEWIEPVNLEEYIDLSTDAEKKRSGLRMKGGGRAVTLFANDEYSFDEKGTV
jgi:hypothetical protein